MTTEPKTAKATLKEAAPISFEPWLEDPECKIPALAEFEPHLIASRITLALMSQSKAELTDTIIRNPNPMLELFKNLETSRRFFQAAADLIDGARTRLLVAGASYTEAA
jgi:hypothetical protein